MFVSGESWGPGAIALKGVKRTQGLKKSFRDNMHASARVQRRDKCAQGRGGVVRVLHRKYKTILPGFPNFSVPNPVGFT